MASIVRRVRKFFGRVRKFRINTDKKKDAIPYDDADKMVQLTGYRNLSDSLLTELTSQADPQNENLVEIIPNGKPHSCTPNDETASVESNSSEENSNDKAKGQIEYSVEPLPDIEARQCNEALESAKNSHDNNKIEIIRDNIDWSVLDEMKEEFKKKYSRYLVKKQNFDEINCSPVQDTFKQENTSAIMMEKDCQVSPKSAHSKKSPNNEELDIKDIVLEEDSPIESFELLTKVKFQIEKVTPDVLLEVDEDNKFLVHRQKLLIESGYFLKRLRVPNKSFWSLKVDPKYVDPKALKCILHFLYESKPFTCRHFAKVITTAIYLEMNYTICSLQLIIFNRKFCVNINLRNSLLKYALAFEIKSQLDNSQIVATDDLNNVHVIVKGQKGDLTEEDLESLCDFEYIQIQSERSVNFLTSRGGNEFEQVAVRPHVVVDITDDGLTLWVFNVFKSNFDKALFIDAQTWKSSLETSLQISAEYLSQHYQELLLKNAHLQLNEAQLIYILQQDIVGKGRNEPTQNQDHSKRLLQLLDQHRNTQVLKLECKSREEIFYTKLLGLNE